MKGLNKLALATAVAAAPFATQAMEPMNDSQMGDVTGQAGVTIELETAMTIDQVAYSQGDETGSFLIGGGDQGIRIGGFEEGETLDLSMDIDLQPNGDALISLDQLNDEHPAVQLGMDIDEMGLQNADGDESATLISSMEMDMFLSKLDITAQVDNRFADADADPNTGSLNVEVGFGIDNLDIDFDVAAVSLEGFRMAGDGSMAKLQDDNRGTGKILGEGSAVVDMTIGAGESISGAGGNEDGNVLRIDLDNFQADMWMPTINVGGGSVGSVAISNLQVTDTSMAIYGR